MNAKHTSDIFKLLTDSEGPLYVKQLMPKISQSITCGPFKITLDCVGEFQVKPEYVLSWKAGDEKSIKEVREFAASLLEICDFVETKIVTCR